MIIWINGAFGAGKTTVSEYLCARIEDSFLYDPELTGAYLNQVIPRAIHPADFQDYELWREYNYKTIKYIYDRYKGTIIIPMTIVNKAYYDEIAGRLLKDGCELSHFILCVDKPKLVQRLGGRTEEIKTWGINQIDHCIKGFQCFGEDCKIDVNNKSVRETALEITKKCGLAMNIQ